MSATKHVCENTFALLALSSLAITACAVVEPARDTEVTPLWRKAPTEEARALWVDDVQAAIDGWQAALGTSCAFPLFVGPSGPPVLLVAVADWEIPGAIGAYWVFGSVDVMGDAPMQGDTTRTLAHEFGHAVGLEHSADPRSVMYAYYDDRSLVEMPTEVDGAVLRRHLGCE